MNLLAVDTSTASCSVALFAGRRLLGEVVYSAGQSHSRQLLSMIHKIFKGCGWDPMAVDGIAVAKGPGTFTGLRIGISTIKGLAVAAGASVVGVSSLAALAWPFSKMDCPVVALIDARRGEVYHALYRSGSRVTPMAVAAPDRVAAVLPDDAVLVGSGAVLYQDLFLSHCPGVRFADPAQHVIRASSVGLLAMARFQRHDVDAVDTLIPEYIRKSDAQIQLSGCC